jgi:hypothetical protein
VTETAGPHVPDNYEVRRPSLPAPDAGTSAGAGQDAAAASPEVSWDTERDARYARYLRDHSGGLIKKAAVAIEDRGELRVEISRAVEPDDTLPLTKSLLAGARKDFPDRPITLSLYDPDGRPILKARYRPGEGVRYQIAHGGGGGTDGRAAEPQPAPPSSPSRSGSGDVLSRGGVTDRDREFAAWAEKHGQPMIRYVEADLERHGRLWVGVTRATKPEDVKPLTQSLLEGARKEFPRGELSAMVFDPDGERIGRARLGRDGEVRWER